MSAVHTFKLLDCPKGERSPAAGRQSGSAIGISRSSQRGSRSCVGRSRTRTESSTRSTGATGTLLAPLNAAGQPVDLSFQSPVFKDGEAVRASLNNPRDLPDLIREAAAGGLRLETIGVCFFALGVVLGTLGNLA